VSDVLILLAGNEDAIKAGWLLLTGKFAIPFLGIEMVWAKFCLPF